MSVLYPILSLTQMILLYLSCFMNICIFTLYLSHFYNTYSFISLSYLSYSVEYYKTVSLTHPSPGSVLPVLLIPHSLSRRLAFLPVGLPRDLDTMIHKLIISLLDCSSCGFPDSITALRGMYQLHLFSP